MSSLVWIDPINRDAHFLKLVSEVICNSVDDFKLITSQRSGIEFDSNIPFKPFLDGIEEISTGTISLTKKINIVGKYYAGFQRVVNNIYHEDVVLYSSGMSLPELEYLGVQKIKKKASKVVMLIHNLEDTQSKFLSLSELRNQRLIKSFDGWVFLSKHMRQKALSRLDLPLEKTYILPHPHFNPMLRNIQVDQKLASDITEFAKGRTVISYVSRLDSDHGIDIFYKILYEMNNQGLPICGMVLGRLGVDWNSRKNEATIKKYGLTTDKLYAKPGTYTYPELLSVLSKTDCVIAPYRKISQSGAIALVLGQQVPVIASKAGANSEMVKDGINGFLFDTHDLDSLVKRLSYIYGNGSTMRQHFLSNTSFNTHLDPYAGVSNMLAWLNE